MSTGERGDCTTVTVMGQEKEAEPRLIAAPLLVATTVTVHEDAAAHDTGESTRSCPSHRPIEKGSATGGFENAHVIVVPTFVVVAESADPTNVPVGERSTTAREAAQLETTGGRIICDTYE